MPDSPQNDARLAKIVDWLGQIDTPQLLTDTLRPASADASFRRYFRVDTTQGNSLIVMDAPPPQEDVRPFLQVPAYLGTQALRCLRS